MSRTQRTHIHRAENGERVEIVVYANEDKLQTAHLDVSEALRDAVEELNERIISAASPPLHNWRPATPSTTGPRTVSTNHTENGVLVSVKVSFAPGASVESVTTAAMNAFCGARRQVEEQMVPPKRREPTGLGTMVSIPGGDGRPVYVLVQRRSPSGPKKAWLPLGHGLCVFDHGSLPDGWRLGTPEAP